MPDLQDNPPPEMAAAVGRAIIAWQRIELRCCEMFMFFVAGWPAPAPAAIFYHIKNFSTRLDLLDLAAAYALEHSEPLREQWGVLHTRLREAGRIRNRIAHQDFYADLIFGGEPRLQPHLLDISRYDVGSGEKWAKRQRDLELTCTEIEKAAESFRELAEDVTAFTGPAVAQYQRRLEERGTLQSRQSQESGSENSNPSQH